jgi:hypothetical protein
MNIPDAFQRQLIQAETIDKPKTDATIEDLEDYFRTSTLARVSILPRWILS